LLDTQDGKTYRYFRDFVSAMKPWGLGTDYEKFRSLIISEIDERELDRWTISEPGEAGRPAEGENLGIQCRDLSKRRVGQLRAINRAPADIQKLYDDDLIAVDLAAKFGAKDDTRKEDMQSRSDALQRRVDALRIFRRDLPAHLLKREINRAAREILELKVPTPFDVAWEAFKKLDDRDKKRFLARAQDKA